MSWHYSKQSCNNVNVQVLPLGLEFWTSQWHHPVRGVRAHVLTIQVHQLSKLPFFHHPIHAVCQWEWTCPRLFISKRLLWIAIRTCPMHTHIGTYTHTNVYGCMDTSNLTHQPLCQDQSCSNFVGRAINNFSIIANGLNRDLNQVWRPLFTRLSDTR